MKITRVRGDTYADQFSITAKSTGLPADLTGCTFKMTLSRVANPADATSQVYQIVGEVDSSKGIVSFYPSTQQADQVGAFFFDVQMTDGAGRIRTIALDSYTYTQDITKT